MTNVVLMIGTSELLLIGGLVLLLFGGKKLPEMMRGLGQGVKSFKEGMREESEEDADKPHSTLEEDQDERPVDKAVDNVDKTVTHGK